MNTHTSECDELSLQPSLQKNYYCRVKLYAALQYLKFQKHFRTSLKLCNEIYSFCVYSELQEHSLHIQINSTSITTFNYTCK